MTTNWTAVLALLGALMIGGVPTTAQASLLSNASFESVLEYDPANANGPNWFAFFGGGSTGTVSTVDPAFAVDPVYAGLVADPTDGANHLVITNDGTPSGFSGVFQRAATSPGLTHTFAFDARSGEGSSFPLGAELRIEWFDAGGGALGATPNTLIGGALTGAYQNFDVMGVAPAGAAFAQAVIAVETFSASGAPGVLFVDNASLTAVPEPTALAVLGLGVAGALGVRRRR